MFLIIFDQTYTFLYESHRIFQRHKTKIKTSNNTNSDTIAKSPSCLEIQSFQHHIYIYIQSGIRKFQDKNLLADSMTISNHVRELMDCLMILVDVHYGWVHKTFSPHFSGILLMVGFSECLSFWDNTWPALKHAYHSKKPVFNLNKVYQKPDNKFQRSQ